MRLGARAEPSLVKMVIAADCSLFAVVQAACIELRFAHTQQNQRRRAVIQRHFLRQEVHAWRFHRLPSARLLIWQAKLHTPGPNRVFQQIRKLNFMNELPRSVTLIRRIAPVVFMTLLLVWTIVWFGLPGPASRLVAHPNSSTELETNVTIRKFPLIQANGLAIFWIARQCSKRYYSFSSFDYESESFRSQAIQTTRAIGVKPKYKKSADFAAACLRALRRPPASRAKSPACTALLVWRDGKVVALKP